MAEIHSTFSERIVLRFTALVGLGESTVHLQELVAFMNRIKAAGYTRRWVIEAVYEKYQREREGLITGVSVGLAEVAVPRPQTTAPRMPSPIEPLGVFQPVDESIVPNLTPEEFIPLVPNTQSEKQKSGLRIMG